MPNAYGGDLESFQVDPKKIAETIALKQEIERLKKENSDLRDGVKKNANGHFRGQMAPEENVTVGIVKGSSVVPVAVCLLYTSPSPRD